jgi:hypothetical protein
MMMMMMMMMINLRNVMWFRYVIVNTLHKMIDHDDDYDDDDDNKQICKGDNTQFFQHPQKTVI